MAAAQLLFTYAAFMNKLYHTAPLRLEAWLYMFRAGTLACAVVDFEKRLRRRGRPKFPALRSSHAHPLGNPASPTP